MLAIKNYGSTSRNTSTMKILFPRMHIACLAFNTLEYRQLSNFAGLLYVKVYPGSGLLLSSRTYVDPNTGVFELSVTCLVFELSPPTFDSDA